MSARQFHSPNPFITTIIAAAIFSLSVVCTASAAERTIAYVTNTLGGVVQVCDIDARTILKTISVGEFPVDIKVSPDEKWLYVSNRTSATISVIDSALNEVVATIPVGARPEGIDLSPDGSRLYVVNTADYTVSVVDTGSRTVTKTIPVGAFPGHVAVSPDGLFAYVTNRAAGTLSVINTASLSVVDEVPAGLFPWYISLSPDGTEGYITNVGSSKVTRMSMLTRTITGEIPVGNGPWAIHVNPDPLVDQVYVTNADDGTITFLRKNLTLDRVHSIGTDSIPYEIDITPRGNSLLVPNYGAGTLLFYKIKQASLRDTGFMTLGGTPTSVASILADM